MAEIKSINVKVYRYNPQKDAEPSFQTYMVPYEEGQSVLGVLKSIFENQDASLAFYHSCRIGKCTGCHMKVNGKVRLVCTELADEKDLVIEPHPGYEVVRDLVVDKTKAGISGKGDLSS